MLRLDWKAPVEVHRIVVRQNHDRVIYFSLEVPKADGEYGFMLASIHTAKRNSFVRGSRDPELTRIDGLRVNELGQRQFGAMPNNGKPTVFEFFLRRPIKIHRLQLQIRETSLDPVEISEVEVYGRLAK